MAEDTVAEVPEAKVVGAGVVGPEAEVAVTGDVACDVYDMTGSKVGTAALDGRVFAAPIREKAVHAVVRYQLAKRRAGTHSCLNRAAIGGSGKKMYRQKGTGRARAGDRMSPTRVGGAVAHGPTPRSYEFSVPKKVRRQALASVLTDKLQQGRLLLLDKLDVESAKTRDMDAVLKALGLDSSSSLIVLPAGEEEQAVRVERAARNIPSVLTLPVEGVNVYDLLRCEALVGTKDSVASLGHRIHGLDDNQRVEE